MRAEPVIDVAILEELALHAVLVAWLDAPCGYALLCPATSGRRQEAP